MSDHSLFQANGQGRHNLAKGSVKLLIALQIILVVLVLSGVYAATSHLRQTTLDNLQTHAYLQAQNLSDRMTQSMNLIQIHLEALISDYPDAAIDIEVLRDTLQQLQNKLVYIRSISVLDVSGKVFVSTRPANEHSKIELGSLYPQVPYGTTNLLRFAAPWYGRDFANGKQFQNGISIERPDPGFIPVTLILPEAQHWTFLIAINNDYFINIAPPHKAAGDLVYRFFLDDGTLLLSTAEHEQPGSQQLLSQKQLEQVLQNHSGSERWLDADNQLQLSTYHAAHNYPWFVQAQAGSDFVLRQWRQDSRRLWLITGITLGIMLLVGGGLTLRVSRSLKREERLLEQTSLAAMVFLHSSDLIAIADRQRKIIAVNPAYQLITGFAASEVLGKIPGTFRNDADSDVVYARLWEHLDSHDQWQGEVAEYHKDGHLIAGQLQVNVIRDPAGKLLYYVGVFKDMSKLHESEATIRKLSQAVEQSPSSIVMTTPSATIEYANPQFLKSTGYTREEVIGVNPRILQSGKTPMATYFDLWGKISVGQVWNGEFINKRKDGSIFYERSSISPVLDGKGNLSGYLGIKHDITSEKKAEQAMRLAARVTTNTAESIMICDADELIVEVNPAFTRLTGYSSDEVLGQHPNMLVAIERNTETLESMYQTLQQQDEWQGEFWNRRKNGSIYATSGTISLIRDEAGNLTHYVSVFSDITESKMQQENLKKQAHFDPLTGLPNRILLGDRLEQAMARARRHQHSLAVCFMDLDGFKQVNDTHGHHAGDELLVCIASRLKDCLRADDTAARLGGDEFILLLSPVGSMDECAQVAQRVLDAVARPVRLASGQMVMVTGSMGITMFPQDNSNIDQLLRHADHAMYQAKQNGRNCYVISPKALTEQD